MPCSHLPPADLPDPLRVEDAHLTETVLLIARGIAADLGFDRLPILADALEDANCDNFALLNHLRSDEPHRVECWALRRLLRTTLLLPGGVPITFAYCPPGTFLMGCPESQTECFDDNLREVRLTKGLHAGVHPVTQAQWRAVMGTTEPCHFTGDDRPAESLSWEEARMFCERASGLTGEPVRLPTEAEWEYAARGGTATPFYWGAELNGTQANCDGRSPYGTAPVGPYLQQTSSVGRYAVEFPHPWGLTDVIGNVWEWCADWYDEVFCLRSPVEDPECRDGEQKQRVLRGGSWLDVPKFCRANARSHRNPDVGDARNRCGFRVVFTAT